MVSSLLPSLNTACEEKLRPLLSFNIKIGMRGSRIATFYAVLGEQAANLKDRGLRYPARYRLNISIRVAEMFCTVFKGTLPNFRTKRCRSTARIWSNATCPRLP